jgi:hypothetical protein
VKTKNELNFLIFIRLSFYFNNQGINERL